jgi:hypothetical protein
VQGGRYKNKATAMDQILKQEMTQLKEEVGEIKETVGDIYSALMGNKLAKDGGLVSRIAELERENELLKVRVEILEKEKGKSDIYVKIIWGAAGVICTAVIGFVLSLIIKR